MKKGSKRKGQGAEGSNAVVSIGRLWVEGLKPDWRPAVWRVVALLLGEGLRELEELVGLVRLLGSWRIV